MNSLSEQHIDALPPDNREQAYRQVGMVCVFRSQGLSEDEIAEKARFDSVEDMYFRLNRWGLPGLLPESEKTVTPPRERKAHSAKGERQQLPTIENAATTFEDTIATLKVYLEHTISLKETRQGGYFIDEGETEEDHIREARGG